MTTDSVELFKDAYEGLAGHVHLVSDIAGAADIVGRVAGDVGATTVALSLDEDELTVAIQDAHRSRYEILAPPFPAGSPAAMFDGAQLGVTSAAFAVAEAGALVEFATDDARRLISTLPRTHIGVVKGSEVVRTLKEAAPRVREFMESQPSNAAVTFISGPSRTADIEMQLTLGVHGPEQAHVIILT